MNLDLTNTPEPTGFKPIDPGTYTVVVDNAEVKETKAGTGSYINVKFKIADSNRFLFHSFNIKNPNEKAVEIGLQQLKGFMKCAGWTDFKLSDVGMLIGCRADAVVKTKTDEYGEKSVISYFKPVGEKAAPAGNGASPF